MPTTPNSQSVCVPAQLEASLCRLAGLGSQADDGIGSCGYLAGSFQSVAGGLEGERSLSDLTLRKEDVRLHSGRVDRLIGFMIEQIENHGALPGH